MAKYYKNLQWYVFASSMSNKEIKKYNIFNHSRFYEDVVKDLKKCETKEEFAERLRGELFYYFGSKCEWEVVITDWPCHIKVKELDRLNAECEETREKYNREPYSLYVNLDPAIKVDVYTQVYNNWDIFLDYVWSFKKPKRTKKVNN